VGLVSICSFGSILHRVFPSELRFEVRAESFVRNAEERDETNRRVGLGRSHIFPWHPATALRNLDADSAGCARALLCDLANRSCVGHPQPARHLQFCIARDPAARPLLTREDMAGYPNTHAASTSNGPSAQPGVWAHEILLLPRESLHRSEVCDRLASRMARGPYRFGDGELALGPVLGSGISARPHTAATHEPPSSFTPTHSGTRPHLASKSPPPSTHPRSTPHIADHQLKRNRQPC
jgi:hypothetical protein